MNFKCPITCTLPRDISPRPRGLDALEIDVWYWIKRNIYSFGTHSRVWIHGYYKHPFKFRDSVAYLLPNPLRHLTLPFALLAHWSYLSLRLIWMAVCSGSGRSLLSSQRCHQCNVGLRGKPHWMVCMEVDGWSRVMMGPSLVLITILITLFFFFSEYAM